MTPPLELFRNSSVLVAWTVPNYDYYDAENLPFCPKQKSKTTFMNQIQKWFSHEDEWGKGLYLKKPSAPEFKTYVSWSRKILPKFPHQFSFGYFVLLDTLSGPMWSGSRGWHNSLPLVGTSLTSNNFQTSNIFHKFPGAFPTFLFPMRILILTSVK